jgi:hypothetical protein
MAESVGDVDPSLGFPLTNDRCVIFPLPITNHPHIVYLGTSLSNRQCAQDLSNTIKITIIVQKHGHLPRRLVPSLTATYDPKV